MGPKFQWDGTWVYVSIGAALEMVGLEEIGAYIARRQNTVAQYILTRPVMDLCLVEEWKTGMRLYMQWWENTTLYILRIRARHAEEEKMGIKRGWKNRRERERDSRGGKDEGRRLIRLKEPKTIRWMSDRWDIM